MPPMLHDGYGVNLKKKTIKDKFNNSILSILRSHTHQFYYNNYDNMKFSYIEIYSAIFTNPPSPLITL